MFEFAAPGGYLISKEIALLNFFVFAGQNVHSGKFEHLKFSENDKIIGTNNFVSILEKALKYFYCNVVKKVF